MPLSQQFMINRAKCTESVQRGMESDWVWPGKTMAQWEADLETYDIRLEASMDAHANLRSMKGGLDWSMNRLHEGTLVYLTVLKSLQRDDEVHRELLEVLTARGGSRNIILDEATDLQTAWQEIDAAWEPRPGVTLESFILQIKECAEMKTEFTKANTAWRNRASELRVFLEKLNAACVAWYSAATVLFPENTVWGGVIRSMVPTTYVPQSQPAPPEPVT